MVLCLFWLSDHLCMYSSYLFIINYLLPIYVVIIEIVQITKVAINFIIFIILLKPGTTYVMIQQ